MNGLIAKRASSSYPDGRVSIPTFADSLQDLKLGLKLYPMSYRRKER